MAEGQRGSRARSGGGVEYILKFREWALEKIKNLDNAIRAAIHQI